MFLFVEISSSCFLFLWASIGLNFLLLSKSVYSVIDVMKKLQEYVDDINDHVESLESRGPVSKYVLPDEDLRGRCVFSFFYMN